MRVRLLGTGAADGWPNPFCTCASCLGERQAGRLRGQSAALVNDTLLLDCGPETPRAALRAGVDLSRLRHVLLTHAHPDHCAPAALLFRSWVTSAHQGPLDVVGPADVVDAWRPWAAPDTADTAVRFVPVTAGDEVELGGDGGGSPAAYAVRVLAARHRTLGEAVLFDVSGTGADGASGRVLYATDTGPLPEQTVHAVRDARFDAVLLEETFGDHADHGTDHLDLATFPEQVRRLRAAGAVTDATDVVAVHLSHHNPPTPELARRLAPWGARVVDDGALLEPGRPPGGNNPGPRRTLVLGGARSGKSREAERLLAAEQDVTYVATAYPSGSDPEWDARIARHRADRPPQWATRETLDLVGLLDREGGPLLVDCLTLWLTRVMDEHGAWDDAAWESGTEAAVNEAVDALVTAWRGTARRVVAVSNEVGQGVVPDTAAGRRFRDQLGRLNARLAAATEDVRWCAAGRVSPL